MKWFKHDSDASIDAKMQEVLLDYGLEGYGLYWYCLELIASSVDKHNLNFELEHDARIIARNTGSTVQKTQEMMARFVELGLFENIHGRIFCLKMASRTDEYTAQLMRENKKSIEIVPILSLETPDSVPRKSEVIEQKRREENITEEKRTEPSLAASVCLEVKKFGILDVNPANPSLLKLLDAGATLQEFVSAAEHSKVKKFTYVIGVVNGQRNQAAEMKVTTGTVKPKEDLGWRNNDLAILKKAKELGIHTQGKNRFELLAKIDEKRGAI